MAAPLTPEEALARVSSDARLRALSGIANPSLVYTVKTASNAPAAYVFDKSGRNGFMILSADDLAYPVLGYSESGVFDIENIPSTMQWWLSEYARMIDWAESKGQGMATAPSAPEEWQTIEPLCTTKWDQGSPYNDECPTAKGTTTKCYTGCVATSMAQALKYHNYPEYGTGSVSYTPANVGHSVSMDFSNTKFDWANMLDVYDYGKYNTTQSTAVATLMKACGYAVNMNYGTSASGASGASISTAFCNYFNMDVNCRTEYRMVYSMSEWSKLIYDNLKNVGPVIINGHDPGEMGHSFICDGYDGNGYFHFNWGWSGMADGWFTLDALNPDSMGIGGFGSGFNFSQNAIVGIQPPVSTTRIAPTLVQSGNLTAQLSGSTVRFGTSDYSISDYEGWINYSGVTINGNFGAKFEPVDGGTESEIVDATVSGVLKLSIPANSIVVSTKRMMANLPQVPNGKYKVTLMVHPEGYDWQPVIAPWGYNNFVYMDKNDVGWSVSVPDFGYLQVKDATIETELYNGYNVLVKATIENKSDKELTQGFTARLINNKKAEFLGPNILLTVGPNETVTRDLIFTFKAADGVKFSSHTDYELNLINPETGRSYGMYGTYTMTTGPKAMLLALKALDVVDATKIDVEYAGTTRNAYAVWNVSDFNVDFNYSVRTGYFDKIMKLSVYEVSPESIGTLSVIEKLENVYRATPFLKKNELSENVVNIKFPDAKPGVLYALVAHYGGEGSWSTLGNPTYFMLPTSGVEGVMSDFSEEKVEYYDMQGMKIAEPYSGQMVIRRIGSKAEKVIF